MTLVGERETSVLDLPPTTIERLYKAHGAILLRGFDIDVAVWDVCRPHVHHFDAE